MLNEASGLTTQERIDYYIRLLSQMSKHHAQKLVEVREQALRENLSVRLERDRLFDVLHRTEIDAPGFYFRLAFRAVWRIIYKRIMRTMMKWRISDEELPEEYR